MRTYSLCALWALILILPIAALAQTLDDYTLYPNGNLILQDRVKIKNSLLGSGTAVQMGFDSVLQGNVLSKGNMVMRDRAIVTGNVTLSGTLTLQSQAKVTGTITQRATVPSITIPTITFSAGTTDVSVGSGAPQKLAPGAYRNVQVSTNGGLYLESGTYSLNTLTLGQNATLYFNCSNGPVDLRVLTTLTIGKADRLIINQGTLSPSDIRIYSHQTTALQIGTDSRIEAILTVPRASVTVGDRTAVAGKLRANAITIGYDVSVNGSPVDDTDGDGMPDGWEIAHGLNPNVNDAHADSDADGLDNLGEFTTGTDPNDSDTDDDGIKDGDEFKPALPHHTIDSIGPQPRVGDSDGDSIDAETEASYGLDPAKENTLPYMNDRKYYQMVNHMGEWAVSPTTSHLNPNAASPAAWILGANVGFGDDSSTNMSIDRQMEFSVFLPQDGKPITLKLDFVYTGSSDSNDRFYDIKYSGAVPPDGDTGAPPIYSPVGNSNTITWKITDPLYLLKGDYFFTFSYHYDKNSGEQPRQIRMYASYDDGTRATIAYVTPVNGAQFANPLHFNLLVTGGNQPAYLRGETTSSTSSSTYIDNVAIKDSNGNLVRNIGKKAYNGYWFQYPLGKVNACTGAASGLSACNRLEFDWAHDPAATAQHTIFALDEAGNDWNKVQITYDAAYATQDYFSWSGGVATDTAVLRRGKSFRVIATDSSLQSGDAKVTIKNRAGTDVTSLFNIHKESGQEDYAAYNGGQTTWRENWIIETPLTAPVGKYTIFMSRGTSWTGTTPFYLIFNRSEFSLSDEQYSAYAYQEDSDGLALPAQSDLGFDIYDLYDVSEEIPLNAALAPFTKTVTDIAVAAIESKTSQFDARDNIRLFTNKLIYGCWNTDPPCDRDNDQTDAGGQSDKVLQRSGVTIAEVLAGTVSDSHLLFGDCITFAQMSVALSRSIGIPSRMVTGRGGIYKPNAVAGEPVPGASPSAPSGETWIYHVWSEAWIENPPSGTDKWYVFDATDFVGSPLGSASSRLAYGSLWVNPSSGMIEVADSVANTYGRGMLMVKPLYKP